MAGINSTDGTIDKKIEVLEKKIQELEKKLNQSNNMFGRSYSQVGNSDQDFLIKTRGQIKIQYGSKFIDLIKNGKLNYDSKFIYSVNSINDINKEGIYIVNGQEIYLKPGSGSEIPLLGELNDLFVSYSEQESTNEQKQQALINLGLVCNSDSIPLIQNGFVYVTDLDQIFIVKDGQLSALKTDFPNPLLVQLVIDLKGSKEGSLALTGTGRNNGLNFGNSWLYEDDGIVLQNDSKIKFILGNREILSIDLSKVIINSSLTVDSINSRNFDITNNGEIYCERLYERNPIISNSDTYIYYKKTYIKNSSLYNENIYELETDILFSEGSKVLIFTEEIIEEEVDDNIIETPITQYIGTVVTVEEPEDGYIYVDFGIGIEEDLSKKYIYLIEDSLKALVLKNNSLYLGYNEDLILGYNNNEFVALYPEGYELPENDSSIKFASTEWVTNKINIPSGIITLFDKTLNPPDGWSDYNNDEINFTNLKLIIKN